MNLKVITYVVIPRNILPYSDSGSRLPARVSLADLSCSKEKITVNGPCEDQAPP